VGNIPTNKEPKRQEKLPKRTMHLVLGLSRAPFSLENIYEINGKMPADGVSQTV
jgi:hypothetical protein